jgi:hypothetical protein
VPFLTVLQIGTIIFKKIMDIELRTVLNLDLNLQLFTLWPKWLHQIFILRKEM